MVVFNLIPLVNQFHINSKRVDLHTQAVLSRHSLAIVAQLLAGMTSIVNKLYLVTQAFVSQFLITWKMHFGRIALKKVAKLQRDRISSLESMSILVAKKWDYRTQHSFSRQTGRKESPVRPESGST